MHYPVPYRSIRLLLSSWVSVSVNRQGVSDSVYIGDGDDEMAFEVQDFVDNRRVSEMLPFCSPAEVAHFGYGSKV